MNAAHRTLHLTHLVRPLAAMLATATLAVATTFSPPALARPGMEHGHGGPGMGMAFFAGPHIDRALDSVNATAEQKAQIKQIMDSLRSDMKAQREGGSRLAEQAAGIFTAPTVDARAAETLRQQMLAQHDKASQRSLQAMLDASRVLSAEQRQKLGQQMQQRRALMQRHRSERDALDGTATKAR